MRIASATYPHKYNHINYITPLDVIPTPFILKLIENLKELFKNMYPQFNFVVIGIIKSKEIEVRFHMLCDNEKGWLSEAIDGYNEAIVIDTV